MSEIELEVRLPSESDPRESIEFDEQKVTDHTPRELANQAAAQLSDGLSGEQRRMIIFRAGDIQRDVALDDPIQLDDESPSREEYMATVIHELITDWQEGSEPEDGEE